MKNIIAILLILVMIFALGCVALADTNVDSPTGGDEEHENPSPQTGDLTNIVWVVAAAILAVGVAFFCGRKLIIEK